MTIYYRHPDPVTEGLARINAKEREKEKERGTEGETPNPIPCNRCANSGWRAERKTEENKNKNREQAPNPATLGHSVAYSF